MLQRNIVSILFVLFAAPVWSAVPFVVEDIKLEGLQRISVGTVFNYLPIQVGDTVDQSRTAEAIRALYKTGFFQDVKIFRDGSVLIVRVKERPAIADIEISGNKDISTEQLTEALKQIGLAKGRTFDRSLLDKVEQELQRQYFSRGKYSVEITSTVDQLERNRVDLKITIKEGGVARIAQVNIVGNQAFSDEQLSAVMQLGPRGTWGLFSRSDQYSQQKLAADLESLKSFYLDRGFINFSVTSTQVAITADRKDVYITINVAEGQKYTVSRVDLSGDLVVDEAVLRHLISVRPGDVFSRRQIAESSRRISERLGQEGYAFANINPIPQIDKNSREVALTFFVDPGRRIYVRRITISGNTRTQDEVLRREIRQMESAWIATDKINRSRIRLQRLGYFEDVSVETPTVPGVEDQVDVNFDVVERSSGTLQAGLGFSESQGLLFTASISHNNFLGSGKRISAEINNSQVNTIYSFSYTNPYYTLDGVSRGIRGFFRQTDSAQRNTAAFNSDVYGAGVDYGIPVSEFNRVSVGFSFEHTKIKTTPSTPAAYLAFLDEHTDEFDALKLTTGWAYDSRNRAIFPTKGFLQSINGEFSLPKSGIQYYKASLRSQYYHPLSSSLTLMANAQLGYGDGFGNTRQLPFFENFFAGGSRTVRGYRSNTLGPKELGDPLGGALKVTLNLEFIFPVPFNPDAKSVRLSYFLDTGNVFADKDQFDVSDFRHSTGLSMVWLSPLGPMVFSLASPLNDKEGDQTERFQFTLGTGL